MAMPRLTLAMLLAVALVSISTSVHAQLLSIHDPQANNTERTLRLAHISTQIKNEPRSVVVQGKTFPLYVGPAVEPGSLAQQIQMQELFKLKDFGLPTSETVAALAAKWALSFGSSVDDIVTFYQDVLDESPVAAQATKSSKTFQSIQDYTKFYDLIVQDLEKPWSTDNSDEAFGAQRLVMKGFTMRLVHTDEYTAEGSDLSLTDAQLAKQCGHLLTKATIREKKALFVTEMDNVSQYNDRLQKHIKYVPDVIGFFCFNNDTQHLLPVEIRLPETGLAYTPFDTEDEWTLAKMALEATEIDYQNMQHMAETHAMTIPMRVEAYRTMDASHPIYQLFTHHVFADFALEMLSEKLLLNISTEVDATFGFGATGSLRFIYDHMTQDDVYVSVTNDFPTDVARRGLENIPNHKYVQYGKLYYAAFDGFVKALLDVYYPSDKELISDLEVQNWAKACALIPHLRGFPSQFTSKKQLQTLLTHLIFQSTFKHHAMNGLVSWHGVSMPYSVPALWHPLPKMKQNQMEEDLDLMKYTIPKTMVAEQVRSPAAFYRAIPLSETLLDAYRDMPFEEEPRLKQAIKAYETALRVIDRQLAATEAASPQKWPYHLYRPSKLSYYTWI